MFVKPSKDKQPNVKINLVILAALVVIGGLCLLAAFIYDAANYKSQNPTDYPKVNTH